MLKTAQERSETAMRKEERAREAAQAMREYEARNLAVLANTERLRALRLAKEAEKKEPENRQPVKSKGSPKANRRSS